MPIDPGDLLFIGWDSDNDDVAFVTTTDIAAGEVIYFTDNEWDGSSFNDNEQLIEWTVPAGGIVAGTIVTIDMVEPNAVSFDAGGAVDNITGGNNLSGTNEMFWAFQGTRVGDDVTPTNFVAVIANEDSGSNNQTPNLTNTGLSASNGALIIDGDEDFMQWTVDDTLDDPIDQADLIASILDPTNWTTADGPGNSNPNGVGFIFCFAQGTRIATTAGLRDVAMLAVGQDVVTKGGGGVPIRWIGKRQIDRAELRHSPKLYPVRITSGALGHGLPERDLLVSRQHRMLVSSKIVQRMFDMDDVLVPAIALTHMPGIYVDDTVNQITYFHVLCDDHEVLFAEGAPAESLYLGQRAVSALTEEGRAEVSQLFPEILDPCAIPKTTFTLTSGPRQKKLIARHQKNNKPLLDLLDQSAILRL